MQQLSGESDKPIDLASRHVELSCSMTSNQCKPSGQRRDHLRRRMPEGSWMGVSITIGKPSHASVACDEILSVWRLQPNPREAGKVSNLKIPRLEMKQLKMIVPL